MSKAHVTEKEAEILFTRCFLQSFNLGDIQLLAPNTHQEFLDGYDAAFLGPDGTRELAIQFKSAYRHTSRERFSIKIDQRQLATLQRLYDRDAAFYVFALFDSRIDFVNAQRNLKGSASDFLQNYLCIRAHGLPPDSSSIQVEPKSERTVSIFCQLAGEKKKTLATTTCAEEKNDRRWGRLLLKGFKDGQIGGNPRSVASRLTLDFAEEHGSSQIAPDAKLSHSASVASQIIRYSPPSRHDA